MKRSLVLIFTLSLMVALVSSSLVSCGGGGGGGNGGNGSTVTANTMTFKTLSYTDSNGIGIEAFHLLIPSDWSFDGGIEWRFDNPGAPAVASFRVKGPDEKTELELLPAQSFFSTQNSTFLIYFPIGSKYYGNEVRPYPALGPVQTLKEIIIPRFRGNVTNLQVVSEKALPEIADLLRAGLSSQATTTIHAGSVRIEYELNGTFMEEELYCVIEADNFTTAPNYQNTLWMADYLFTFKAEKGSLDGRYKLFQAMMYSFRLNPQWFNKYVQLIDYLVQQQITIIQGWGQISQIISQTSDDISNMVWQSYNSRNAANDRMAENFSDYQRGTDSYYNPQDQSTVKLPSGYGDAWVNGLGEYILSDNVNYDPNIGSGQNWQRLEIR